MHNSRPIGSLRAGRFGSSGSRYDTQVLDHESLLTLARKVHAAASDRDPQRLDSALRHFAAALQVHVDHETSTMLRVEPAEARMLKRGQERLLASVKELVDQSILGCAGKPETCSLRAEETLALLVLQARDEKRALNGRAA